ncbi:unnamed protein product, partial [Ixodes hexagonus]
ALNVVQGVSHVSHADVPGWTLFGRGPRAVPRWYGAPAEAQPTGDRRPGALRRARGGTRRRVARHEPEVGRVLVHRYRVIFPLRHGGEQRRAALDDARVFRISRGSAREDRVVRLGDVDVEEVRCGEGRLAGRAHAAVSGGVVRLEVLYVVELLLAAALERREGAAQGVRVAVFVEDALLAGQATRDVAFQDERVARSEPDATVRLTDVHIRLGPT